MSAEKSSSASTLEQLLSLAESLNDKQSAADLVIRAIESPNVYSFSDLLEMPLFASLKNDSQYGIYYELLDLFAYGTYLQYLSAFQILLLFFYLLHFALI